MNYIFVLLLHLYIILRWYYYGTTRIMLYVNVIVLERILWEYIFTIFTVLFSDDNVL